jgi:hypothetical protein
LKNKSITVRILSFIAGGGISFLISDIIFDFTVYPFVTYLFGIDGIWKSFLILYVAALGLNYLLIKAYDVVKKDIFSFETIKNIKAGEIGDSDKRKYKVAVFLLKHGDLFLFIFLCWWDPFLATLYKRKSTKFDGLTKADYLTLMLSTFIACIIWSLTFLPLALLRN